MEDVAKKKLILIRGNGRVYFHAPGINTAFQTMNAVKPIVLKVVSYVCAADAVVANHDDFVIGIQLIYPGNDFRHRDMDGTVDPGDVQLFLFTAIQKAKIFSLLLKFVFYDC